MCIFLLLISFTFFSLLKKSDQVFRVLSSVQSLIFSFFSKYGFMHSLTICTPQRCSWPLSLNEFQALFLSLSNTLSLSLFYLSLSPSLSITHTLSLSLSLPPTPPPSPLTDLIENLFVHNPKKKVFNKCQNFLPFLK